jgi:hypothetical protein
MHFQQPSVRTHFTLEFTCSLERQLLGLDERHMAVVNAGATDETAHHPGGLVRQLLEDRLINELWKMRFRNIWDDQVLPRGDSDVARSIGLGSARDLNELRRSDSANRNTETDGIEPGLSLAGNPKVVRVFRRPHVPAGSQQAVSDTTLQFLAKSLDAHLIDEKCEPGAISRTPGAMIAE